MRTKHAFCTSKMWVTASDTPTLATAFTWVTGTLFRSDGHRGRVNLGKYSSGVIFGSNDTSELISKSTSWIKQCEIKMSPFKRGFKRCSTSFSRCLTQGNNAQLSFQNNIIVHPNGKFLHDNLSCIFTVLLEVGTPWVFFSPPQALGLAVELHTRYLWWFLFDKIFVRYEV